MVVLMRIQRAAVLGAGVMGAQIAAHLANAGVPVILYDVTADAAKAGAGQRLCPHVRASRGTGGQGRGFRLPARMPGPRGATGVALISADRGPRSRQSALI